MSPIQPSMKSGTSKIKESQATMISTQPSMKSGTSKIKESKATIMSTLTKSTLITNADESASKTSLSKSKYSSSSKYNYSKSKPKTIVSRSEDPVTYRRIAVVRHVRPILPPCCPPRGPQPPPPWGYNTSSLYHPYQNQNLGPQQQYSSYQYGGPRPQDQQQGIIIRTGYNISKSYRDFRDEDNENYYGRGARNGRDKKRHAESKRTKDRYRR